MKILLVAPAKDNYSGLALFPPIGLGYIASALRKAGYHEVRILDCVLERLTIDGFGRYLRQWRPDVVGINSWSVSVREVAKSLMTVKAISPDTVTVIGGPHPSALRERSLVDFRDADFAFRGEAEIGAPMLMDHLSGRRRVRREEIPGLMWREGGCVRGEDGTPLAREKTGAVMVRSNPQIFEKDLDRFSFPAWDLIRPQRYAKAGTLIQKNTACIVTTRGCPFPCTFCSAAVTAGKAIRARSVENVVSEIRVLYHIYGIRRLVVFDENITMRRPHIRSFSEAVIKEGLDITFELPNGIRLDTLDWDTLLLMRRAGFSERVAVGIESGSERVLSLMKKGITKGEIREKVGLLKRAGFKPIGYFILGFPGETREEMDETVSFAIELKLYRAGFMPFHPLPGTESFNQLVHKGEIGEDFDWALLSTDNVVYSPEGITREELDEVRKRAVLRFNLRPRVIWDYISDYNSLCFAMRKMKSIFLKKGPGTPTKTAEPTLPAVRANH